MRINRFLAAAGVGSRRGCEELILAGRVTINGKVCQNLATDVSDQDFVKVGSRRVLPEKHLYILMHKPRGFLCTASDTHERHTVFELLPAHFPRLFHVGRLDRDSEGLLILTNDGDLTLHLTHPRSKIEKEYEVLLDRAYDQADTAKLLRGVNIEGGRAKADLVWQISPNLIRVVLRQGLKRQIRLMLYKVGYEVERLIRIRIGPLRLSGLNSGEWRALTSAEVKLLQEKPQPEKTVRPETLPSPKTTQRPPGPKSRPARTSEAAGGKRESAPRGARRQAPSRTGFRKKSTGGPAASVPRAARRP